MCSTDIFLGVLAVLFPPLPVWVKRGICSADSVINILLFILGYVPGLLHAWYIIATYPEPPNDYDYHHLPQDAEHGRIYVFVHNNGHGPQPQGYQQQPHAHGHPTKPQSQYVNYGTTGAPSSAASASPQQHPPQEQGTTSPAGPSEGGAPPPSYAQVVAGDHKVQTHD
ncbi:hypothetical protein N657DRAFT_678739 [Parathielavia appendiculata]|uniref:Stress response RCI peptide n=1 Tax=Parathielavia appendiculata TaxID=2587402 RepID=A0AAN6Z563_9PEZI|nr:hypothetical protein N657DRAFT_678739 [Parathielavia appendiculata]